MTCLNYLTGNGNTETKFILAYVLLFNISYFYSKFSKKSILWYQNS